MACHTSCIVLSAAEFCSCAPGIVTLASAPTRASMFVTAAFDMFKPPSMTSVEGHPNSEKMCSISCATPAAVISDIAHSQQNLVAVSMRTRMYLHPSDVRKGPARSSWTFSSGNRVVPARRGIDTACISGMLSCSLSSCQTRNSEGGVWWQNKRRNKKK